MLDFVKMTGHSSSWFLKYRLPFGIAPGWWKPGGDPLARMTKAVFVCDSQTGAETLKQCLYEQSRELVKKVHSLLTYPTDFESKCL